MHSEEIYYTLRQMDQLLILSLFFIATRLTLSPEYIETHWHTLESVGVHTIQWNSSAKKASSIFYIEIGITYFWRKM